MYYTGTCDLLQSLPLSKPACHRNDTDRVCLTKNVSLRRYSGPWYEDTMVHGMKIQLSINCVRHCRRSEEFFGGCTCTYLRYTCRTSDRSQEADDELLSVIIASDCAV